jgi:hypothetical protein
MFGLFKKKQQESKKEYFEDEYSVHVILSKSDNYAIHDWEEWQKCFELLDPILKDFPDKISIRSSQTTPASSKWLSFGRMTWSEKNNIKWTSKYKTGEDKKEELKFYHTEFWSPSWTVCDREKLSPDLFMLVGRTEIGLLNHFFDQWLIIAQKNGSESIDQNLINDLFGSLKGIGLLQGRRPWGKRSSEISWGHSMMHFSPYFLFNKENQDDLEFRPKPEALGEWCIEKRVITK